MGASIPLYSLYGQIKAAEEQRFLHLESLKARNQIYGWNIRPHRHRDLHHLIWVDDGHGSVELDERSLHLRSPVLISVPPPVVHGFRWVPGTEGLILTMAEGYVSDLLRQSGNPEIHVSLSQLLTITGDVDTTSLERIRGLFGAILDEYVHERVCRGTAISSNVLMLFVELARLRHLSLQKGVSEDSAAHEIYRRFKALVENHYQDHWKIADYVGALAMSERSLRRLCMDLVGRTPMQIVHRRLMLEAERSLLYTERTIAEVAYGLGFVDPAYFTRFFTRQSGGDTPVRFRQLRRGER